MVAPVLVGTTSWAAPATAADPAHNPTVYCAAYSRAANAFVFTGVAQAPAGHAPLPTALTVTCRYTSTAGTWFATSTAPGYVVTTAGSGLVGTGAVTVCESAVAVYADGHTATVPERCDNVGMPVEHSSGGVSSGSTSCTHTRQSQANSWLLVGVGVAPVKTVPVTSVTVRCWLTDELGETSAVAGAAPGAVGITGGLVLARIADLTGKCVHMRAVYLDNSVEQATSCEAF